jgi:hypothetical protein
LLNEPPKLLMSSGIGNAKCSSRHLLPLGQQLGNNPQEKYRQTDRGAGKTAIEGQCASRKKVRVKILAYY